MNSHDPSSTRPYSWSHTSSCWRTVDPASKTTSFSSDTIFNVITWNIDFMKPHHAARTRTALSYLSTILPQPTCTFLLFQEISPSALTAILSHPWARENFSVSDIRPLRSYFTTSLISLDLALPSLSIRRVRYKDSKMKRDLLLVDLMLDSGLFRVGNTHLESLPQPGEGLRQKQLAVAARLLKEGNAGVVAGDMNAICEGDKNLPESLELSDAWQIDGGESFSEGLTWGFQPRSRFKPGRLDKVLYTGNVKPMVDSDGKTLKRLGLGLRYQLQEGEDSEGSNPAKGWVSDHYGLWARVQVGDRTLN
ncbi:Endonuclease/exonuclease/phosphatase [Pyronema omphalodes]|nr:Endonuclease/exonuclease/phosphatase [Pyronema omphalodes]